MDNIQKNNKIPTNDSSKLRLLSGKMVSPKRDWNILLIIFAVFMLASIGFDVYMYQQIVSGDMYVSVTKAELVIDNLKSDALQKILDNFEAKKAGMMDQKSENLVDPSL